MTKKKGICKKICALHLFLYGLDQNLYIISSRDIDIHLKGDQCVAGRIRMLLIFVRSNSIGLKTMY